MFNNLKKLFKKGRTATTQPSVSIPPNSLSTISTITTNSSISQSSELIIDEIRPNNTLFPFENLQPGPVSLFSNLLTHEYALIHVLNFVDDQSLIKLLRLVEEALNENVIRVVIRWRENLIAEGKEDFEFICKYFGGDFVRNIRESFENRYLKVRCVETLPEGSLMIIAKYGKVELDQVSFTRGEFIDLLNHGFIRKLTLIDCTYKQEKVTDSTNHIKRTVTLSPYLSKISTIGTHNVHNLLQILFMETLDFSQREGKKLDLIFNLPLYEYDRILIQKLSPCVTGLGILFPSYKLLDLYTFNKILIDNIKQLKENQNCRKLVVNEFTTATKVIFTSIEKLVIKEKILYHPKTTHISDVFNQILTKIPNLKYLVIPESGTLSSLSIGKVSLNNTLKRIQIQSSGGITSQTAYLKYILEQSVPSHVKIAFKKEKIMYESPNSQTPTDDLSIIVRKISNLERMPEFQFDDSFKELVNDVKLRFIEEFNNNSHQHDMNNINKIMEILNLSFKHFQSVGISSSSFEEAKLQEFRKYIQNYLDLVGEDEIYLDTMQALRQAENAVIESPKMLRARMEVLETQFEILVKTLEGYGFSSKLLYTSEEIIENDEEVEFEDDEFDEN